MEVIYKPNKYADYWARYIDSLYSVRPEHPFKEDFVSAVFRHKTNRKWFGLIMEIDARKIPGGGSGTVFVLNIKADPMVIESMVDNVNFFHAYHMNKVHWMTILLNGKEDKEKTKLLIDMSYHLTGPKIKNRNS